MPKLVCIYFRSGIIRGKRCSLGPAVSFARLRDVFMFGVVIEINGDKVAGWNELRTNVDSIVNS